MNQHEPILNLKQRLIAVVLIASIAVIVLPVILANNQEFNTPVMQENIPPLPKQLTDSLRLSMRDIPEPEPMPEIPKITVFPVDELNQHYYPQTVHFENAGIKPQEVAQELVENPYQQSYLIQVGGFASKSNAINLNKKLQHQGVRSYVELAETSEGQLYRVRIGPFFIREQAEEVQKSVKSKFSLDAKLMKQVQ